MVRRTTQRRVAANEKEKSELALLLCDVDNFKDFNDEHGHMIGDECLKAVAQAIAAKTMRPADFAARYGGDEFAVILPNTSAQGAKHIAEQLRKDLTHLQLGGRTRAMSASVTLSIGIGIGRPGGGFTAENLLSIADDALYEAKNRGRNRVVIRSLEDQPPGD